ncbi:MAG: hypothetical protein ABW065_10120 [Solirubrobacterales bacterium]
MGALLATLACIVGVGTCGEPPATTALPVERFAISYERSGGLAAMPENLTVRPGRRASVTIVRRGRAANVGFRLSVKQIKRLRAAAETARVGGLPTPEPGNCADCFVYSVTYRGESASVAEVDVPRRMQPLIDRAEALIAAHRPFH